MKDRTLKNWVFGKKVQAILGFDPEEMFGDTWDTDWRVAGSLMERLSGGLMYWRMDYTEDDIEGGELVQIPAGHVWVVEPERTKDLRQDESLPRAIIEACCAALGEDG